MGELNIDDDDDDDVVNDDRLKPDGGIMTGESTSG